MRKDPYSDTNTKRRGSKPAPDTRATPKRSSEAVNFFGDNPPIRVEITYQNGDQDIFKGAQIDADNPVLKALGNIRTCRRFWTNEALPENKRAWSTDEELLKAAARLGLSVPAGSEAEQAAKVAERLGLTPQYYLTGDDGEPLTDDRGAWLEASPTDASYTPGTHVPPAATV